VRRFLRRVTTLGVGSVVEGSSDPGSRGSFREASSSADAGQNQPGSFREASPLLSEVGSFREASSFFGDEPEEWLCCETQYLRGIRFDPVAEAEAQTPSVSDRPESPSVSDRLKAPSVSDSLGAPSVSDSLGAPSVSEWGPLSVSQGSPSISLGPEIGGSSGGKEESGSAGGKEEKGGNQETGEQLTGIQLAKGPRPLAKDPGSLAKDPGSQVKDPEPLAKDPGPLSKDPGSLAALRADSLSRVPTQLRTVAQALLLRNKGGEAPLFRLTNTSDKNSALLLLRNVWARVLRLSETEINAGIDETPFGALGGDSSAAVQVAIYIYIYVLTYIHIRVYIYK